jgi:hypothetical protein
LNILGHAGLTLGVIYTAGYLVDSLSARQYGGKRSQTSGIVGLASRLLSCPQSIERLGLDFRMVLVGSLLPDIIDKPLGFWLMPEAVNFNVRSVGHSLTFNLLLLAVALLLLVMLRTWAPLTLGLASMGHLLLDEMWRWPDRFLWPLYGWAFPRGSTTLDEWLSFHLAGSFLAPRELAGALFLALFFVQLYRQGAMLRFVKWGTLG